MPVAACSGGRLLARTGRLNLGAERAHLAGIRRSDPDGRRAVADSTAGRGRGLAVGWRWEESGCAGADRGERKIARFFKALASKADLAGNSRYHLARINGHPGYVVTEPDGSLMTVAFEFSDARIVTIHIVRNPHKLRHLNASSWHEDRDYRDAAIT